MKNSVLTEESDSNYNVSYKEGYHSYVTGIYTKPISFNYSGIFDEICIDFEPLGLEYLANCEVSNVRFFNLVIENLFSTKWNTIYNVAFMFEDPFTRARLLEEFILKNIKQNQHNTFIPFNQLNVSRVDELQQHLNLSYRSIHRLYSNSLGISPKEFLKISKFRKGIRDLNCYDSNHAQIAFNVGYADQSHFIRDFKNYTNLTPKQFVKKVSSIGNEVWLNTEV
ncbi:helix-turn-helix domain-containing protein [Xanthomarina gelatinilytica]|uniref:helix-turn-helix domain-containing protein n=1 Tax=Xanthomarina gelatinilytica TaxID=1137281 RepID=UPI003AA7BECE